jgi:tetratricopeptide (TPR) repeat protein
VAVASAPVIKEATAAPAVVQAGAGQGKPAGTPVAAPAVAAAPPTPAPAPTVVVPVPSSPPAPTAAAVTAAAATVAASAPTETRLEADFARARGLIGAGKYEQAVPILVDMATKNPEDALAPEAQFTLAGVCRDMGDHERAVAEYEKLVRTYPASAHVPDARLGKIRTEWDLATLDFGKEPAVIGKVFRAVKKATTTKSYPAGLQQRLVTELQALQAEYAGTPHALEALRLIITVCSPPEMSNDRLAAESFVQLSKLDPEAGPEPLYDAARLYDRKLAEPRLAFELYGQLQARFPENTHAAVVRERLAALRVDPP